MKSEEFAAATKKSSKFKGQSSKKIATFAQNMETLNRKIHQMLHSDKFWQFIRFAVNGCLSSAIHYGVYCLLLLWTYENVAYATGYIVSFIINFFLTSYFTFRTKPTVKRFIGFSGSHAINFALHIVLFNVMLQLGVHRLIAPLFVIVIAMVVQFTILRWVFRTKSETTNTTQQE